MWRIWPVAGVAEKRRVLCRVRLTAERGSPNPNTPSWPGWADSTTRPGGLCQQHITHSAKLLHPHYTKRQIRPGNQRHASHLDGGICAGKTIAGGAIHHQIGVTGKHKLADGVGRGHLTGGQVEHGVQRGASRGGQGQQCAWADDGVKSG